MRTANILVAAIFALTGCFRATNNIKTTANTETEIAKTETKNLKSSESAKTILKTKFAGDVLHVSAQHYHLCMDRTTTYYSNTEVIERSLPGSFWAVFSGSILLIGGGIAMIAAGNSQIQDGESTVLGGPDAEASLDSGKTLVPWGATATGTGSLLLTSSIVDLASSKDEQRVLPETTESTDSNKRKCATEPAQYVELKIKGPVVDYYPYVHHFQTDENGRAVIDILQDQTLKTFPYRTEFGVLTCPNCKPKKLTLPPEISAKLVILHNNEGEFVAWLRAHGSHEAAPQVEEAYATWRKTGDDAEKARLAKLEADCEKDMYDACEEIGQLRELHARGCKRKDAEACVALAEDWANGENGKENDSRARKHYKKACSLKNGDGCLALGDLWAQGEGGKQSWKKALRYYKKGCKLDHEPSCQRVTEINRAMELVKLREIEDRAIVGISSVFGDFVLGHPQLTFDATAKDDIGSLWLVTNARCRYSDKIRVGEHSGLIKELRQGDTVEQDALFVQIESDETLHWCEVAFSLTGNIIWGKKYHFKTICWNGDGIDEGPCQ